MDFTEPAKHSITKDDDDDEDDDGKDGKDNSDSDQEDDVNDADDDDGGDDDDDDHNSNDESNQDSVKIESHSPSPCYPLRIYRLTCNWRRKVRLRTVLSFSKDKPSGKTVFTFKD